MGAWDYGPQRRMMCAAFTGMLVGLDESEMKTWLHRSDPRSKWFKPE